MYLCTSSNRRSCSCCRCNGWWFCGSTCSGCATALMLSYLPCRPANEHYYLAAEFSVTGGPCLDRIIFYSKRIVVAATRIVIVLVAGSPSFSALQLDSFLIEEWKHETEKIEDMAEGRRMCISGRSKGRKVQRQCEIISHWFALCEIQLFKWWLLQFCPFWINSLCPGLSHSRVEFLLYCNFG